MSEKSGGKEPDARVSCQREVELVLGALRKAPWTQRRAQTLVFANRLVPVRV